MSDLTPLTREEYYLARMAGEDVEVPDPITREEEYMKGIAAQIEAGSTELPAVTDADEGKILAVNSNGKWDKINLSNVFPQDGSKSVGKVWSRTRNRAWAANYPEEALRSVPYTQLEVKNSQTFTANQAKTITFNISNLGIKRSNGHRFVIQIGTYSGTKNIEGTYRIKKYPQDAWSAIPLFVENTNKGEITNCTVSFDQGTADTDLVTALNVNITFSVNITSSDACRIYLYHD